MRRSFLYLMFLLVFAGLQESARAQEVVVPAGTLLRCTINEPDFSSATTEVGDPLICHPNSLQEFGRVVFPRGTYMTGHMEAYKDPGHFVGKGWLQLEFDRIGLPNADLPVPGKIIAVRGYRVNREGKIIGHGHPKRDAVEWMFPPLWPWKVLTLPARGPRPALRGEVEVTLRLMDDVAVPQAAASEWKKFGQPRAQSSAGTQSITRPTSSFPVRYLPPITPATQNELGAAASFQRPFRGTESDSAAERQSTRHTLFALKDETIYAVDDYWLESGRLIYVLLSGAKGSVDLREVDWGRTTQLNAERGVTVTLRTGWPAH